jgi:quercetin dioxygenase-like cupin family protein
MVTVVKKEVNPSKIMQISMSYWATKTLITVVKRKMSSLGFASFIMLSATACNQSGKTVDVKEPDSKLEASHSTDYEAAKPYFRASGDSPALYGPGDIYSLLVTGKESNNVFFQFEAIVPEGGGPPPHIHSREDETIYVVSGNVEFRLGDTKHQAKAGDFVYISRGTVHNFKNVGKETAKLILTFSPAGMDDYFAEVFPEVKDKNAPPPPITDELIRKLTEVAPKYGLTFLPPAESEKR